MMARRPVAEDPYRLSEALAALPLPMHEFPVRNATDLLRAFVAGCDSQGRYYADVALLRRLVWWQDIPAQQIEAWRDELIDRGDLRVSPDAINCYSDSTFDVAYLVRPREFQRFQARRKIPESVRVEVYRRDHFRCVQCGSRNRLTLDHIHPWSLNGRDDPDNLQTMCQPCNSRKGARVNG